MQRECGLYCWPLVIAALAGCGSGDASDSESSTPANMRTYRELCSDGLIETQGLELREKSPLGFSADELFDALGAERRTPFTFADGSTSALRVGLERGNATVEFAKSSYGEARPGTSPGDPLSTGNPLIGPGCWDMLSIHTTLAFTTEDGAFAETWPVYLLAWDLAAASGGVSSTGLETLTGRYAVSALDASDYDELKLQATLVFTPDLWSGTLEGAAITLISTGDGGLEKIDWFAIGSF